MKTLSPQSEQASKRRLMHRGLAVTGLGLLGSVIGCGLLIEGQVLPLVALAALVCGGLGLIAVGFGMMVVAADPFAGDELESQDSTESAVS